MPSGLELLMSMLGGTGGNIRDVALGFMLPQLPKIAKGFNDTGLLTPPPGASVPGAPAGVPPGVAPGGLPPGIPPQLLPLLALAARAAQGSQPGGRPPVPPASASPIIPRLASMDTTI